jgi:hypothetical protein
MILMLMKHHIVVDMKIYHLHYHKTVNTRMVCHHLHRHPPYQQQQRPMVPLHQHKHQQQQPPHHHHQQPHQQLQQICSETAGCLTPQLFQCTSPHLTSCSTPHLINLRYRYRACSRRIRMYSLFSRVNIFVNY